MPTDATFEAANSEHVYKLNDSSEATKTELGITLKVMAGDKIDIFGKSIYHQNNVGGSSANSAVLLTTLLNGFLGTPGGATQSGAHGAVAATDINSSPCIDLIFAAVRVRDIFTGQWQQPVKSAVLSPTQVAIIRKPPSPGLSTSDIVSFQNKI